MYVREPQEINLEGAFKLVDRQWTVQYTLLSTLMTFFLIGFGYEEDVFLPIDNA